MKRVQANCPACGGPVQFQISSSLVTVCEFCHSVVARGDRKLEDLGKVAAIVDTGSPLSLGLRGKYNGKSFELVGRVQYHHAAGGSWDEWYAAFSNGKWGWLAEAQGRFYLTFERKPSRETPLPALENVEVGEKYRFGESAEYTAAESGTATAIAAAGEIPYRLVPGALHHYVDLYGPDKTFATFDYDADLPILFLGHEVTLDEIGIASRPTDDQPKSIAALLVSCPKCGGPLELYAPDRTQRVSCPSCGSLLDANQGKLKYFKALNFGKETPLIPLGSKAVFEEMNFVVIGYMRRSVTENEVNYPWSEYLLYNERAGFRWLVQSDRHWSFVKPISPGNVQEGYGELFFDQQKFRPFQKGIARVDYVLGEFYWRVEVGETADTADYIRPPLMVSRERSVNTEDNHPQSKKATEINVSLGTYLPVEALEAAFGIEGLSQPWSVAPHQPNPVDWRVYVAWLGFGAALCLLWLIVPVLPHASKPPVGGTGFWLVVSLMGVSVIPVCAAFYQFSFEQKRWENSDYSPYVSSESDD